MNEEPTDAELAELNSLFTAHFEEPGDIPTDPTPHPRQTQNTEAFQPLSLTTEICLDGEENLNEIIMRCLRATGQHIYQVEGRLVDVKKMDGDYVIEDLTETEFVNYLSRHARLYYTKQTKEGVQRNYVNAPPHQLRKDIIGSRKIIERHVRELKGIVSAPCLLHDGTVLVDEGYHGLSGLFVTNRTEQVPPPSPSRADAQTAAEEIMDIFVDFPFATEADRWLYLVALLTAAGRHALKNAPIPGVFINALDRGAGKSYLTECIAEIGFRGNAARSGWPGQSEMEKRIVAWGLSKPECIVFDNVKTHMGGQAVEDVLTSAKYGGRRLGHTQTVRGRFLSMIIANANSGEMSEDLARRFVHVRLTQQVKKSDEYKMTQMTPVEYAKLHSEEMKMKLITILLAWMQCPQPRDSYKSRRLASFEAWSDLCLHAGEWVAPPQFNDLFTIQRQRERELRGIEAEDNDAVVCMFHEFCDHDWTSMQELKVASELRGGLVVDGQRAALAVSILKSMPRNQQVGRAMSSLLRHYETSSYWIEEEGLNREYVIRKRKRGGVMQWKPVAVVTPESALQ